MHHDFMWSWRSFQLLETSVNLYLDKYRYISWDALTGKWLHAGRRPKHLRDVTDGGDGSNVVMVSKQIHTVGGSSSSQSVPGTAQQQQTSVSKSLTHTNSSRQFTSTEMSSLYGWYCRHFCSILVALLNQHYLHLVKLLGFLVFTLVILMPGELE